MLLTAIRDYYDYTQWANERILDAAAGLTSDQLLTTDLEEVWSIRDTLAHIMISQWAWIERWNGKAIDRYPDESMFTDVASMRDFWSGVHAGMRALLDRLDGEQLAADFTYTNFRGDQLTYPLWEELLQVANHSTYHRGEVAALLTRFGCSPGELDFLIWRDRQKKSA